jgi:hypothetical protein
MTLNSQEWHVKESLYACLLLGGSLLVYPGSVEAQVEQERLPLVLSDAVLPAVSKDPLTDPRIFDPEFYRKFNPELGLSTDGDAVKQWTSSGANHCLRGSFYFSAADYVKRYPDLGLSAGGSPACEQAIRQFVTSGFNQGRIGAFDSYRVVFDFNYYVDAAINPDLNNAFSTGAWDQADLQIHWLRHGIGERRAASPFFNVEEYQARYPDVTKLSPEAALHQYVTQGQKARRLGRKAWADPSEWSALVARYQESVVTAAPNDLVRTFTAANGKETTVTVKSPKWFRGSAEPFPSTVRVCDVPPPSGDNDWNILTTFLTPSGVKPGCDVVRLAPNSAYRLVLPQHQPPSQDYVLNHWPHLQINNAQDFVFDGNGSTLYFTGFTTGIDIFNSQRVVIENLTLDWGNPVDPHPLWRGPLLAAIGTIVPDGADSAHIVPDAQTPIPPGFVPYTYGFNLWDRQKNEIAADDCLNTGPGDQGCDLTCLQTNGQQNPAVQSMHFKDGSLYPASNQTGKFVAAQLVPYPNRAVMVRFQKFTGTAIEVDYLCSDIRIIHTTVHTSPYLGITGGQGGRGLALEDVHGTPSQGRPISTIADGAHFAGVGGDIVVENSSFEREGDDAMNITLVWDTLTAVNAANSFVMNGADGTPSAGDTFAFFDEAMGFLGTGDVKSISSSNLAPWPGPPVTVELRSPLSFLRPGIHAVNMNHAPSRVYISNVNIHDKLGHGIILGGFHMLIQRSEFRNLTSSAIVSSPSTFWSEGAGTVDVAIRDNAMVHTSYVPKFFQITADGTSYYPSRNAAITMFEEVFSTHNGASNTVTGIYPTFQDIEISGNTIGSKTGAGIFLSGTKNVQINDNYFVHCAVVPDADPIYSYFGAESPSAVVLSFAETVSATGNSTGDDPRCFARKEHSSSKDVVVK